MNANDVLQELESLGSEQTRKTYRRHGVKGPVFGVSFANLGKLKKRIKVNHDLARDLWNSGNYDARNLATMIADPKQADAMLLDGWLADIDNYALVDAFAAFAAQTPLARAKMEQWVASPEEWTGRAGWLVLARLAADETTITDAELLPYLDVLASEIHTRPNYTRDAMNSALIAIGVRNPALEVCALETAAEIGKVFVDHGQTNCKTPDAADYIKKTVAYRQKKTGCHYLMVRLY